LMDNELADQGPGVAAAGQRRQGSAGPARGRHRTHSRASVREAFGLALLRVLERFHLGSSAIWAKSVG